MAEQFKSPGEGQEGRGFARALLADEPTTGLDAFQAKIRGFPRKMAGLRRPNWAFMVVS